jgi:hypothetical protein
MGNASSGPRAPWKEIPGLKERVITFCAENGSAAGNLAIRRLIFIEFHILVTQSMVAGAVHRWGILRGHPRHDPIAEPGVSEEVLLIRRARHRAHQNLSPEEKETRRLDRVTTAIERRKDYEANRERKARSARYPNSQHSTAHEPQVNAAAVARHDREMARPALAQMNHHLTEPQRLERQLAATLSKRAMKGDTLPALTSDPGPLNGKLSPVYGRVIECQAVTNTGRHGVGIEWCGKPSKPGKSYCEGCYAIYHTRAPTMREARGYA